MIRIKFKQLLDDKAFKESKKITLNDVVDATGISRTTLSRIQNIPGYPVSLDAIDSLCKYLECQPGELLEYVDNKD